MIHLSPNPESSGLATGSFDTAVHNLRTVSLPNLSEAGKEDNKTSLSDNEDVYLDEADEEVVH